MANRLLYQDRVVGLTSDAIVLRGFTRFLGRARRVELRQIRHVMIRDRSDFPSERLPEWGVDDEGTWFTRDSRRYQRQQAVILTFESGERVGLTPAHAQRFHDLLQQLGVNGD